MIISPQFNGMFHAMLGEILNANKDIVISDELTTSKIRTSKANMEQLKMFLKLTDSKFPRSKTETKIKKVFTKNTNDKMGLFFGVPESIKNILVTDLLNHIKWIKEMSCKNKITLSDDDFLRLLKHIEGEY